MSGQTKKKQKKNKTVEELQKELAEIKRGNLAAWEMYGSELCAGEMSAEERALEEEIKMLKDREATTKKWEALGLLVGLEGKDFEENLKQLFDNQLAYVTESDHRKMETREEFDKINFPIIKAVINPIKFYDMEDKKDGQAMLIADDLMPLIKDGSKKLTVRKGRRDVELGKLTFSSSDELCDVEVVEVRYLRVSGVPNEICVADGFANWVDFYEGMKKYYPDLDVAEECTIVFFE